MDYLNGENKVVGTADCRADKIALAIYRSKVLKESSMTFAVKLAGNTGLDVKKLLKDYAILDKVQFLDVVLTVLEHWVAKAAGEAKLSVLLNVLENDCSDETSGEMVRLLFDLPCAKWHESDLSWAKLSLAFQAKALETLRTQTGYSEADIEKMKPTLSRMVLIDLMIGKRPSPSTELDSEETEMNLC